MTRFVIDAPVAIRLAADGATIPAGHALVAPTLVRRPVGSRPWLKSFSRRKRLRQNDRQPSLTGRCFP